jgi:hypothetical protein
VVVALKVDAETAARLEGLENRSEFIRSAIEARLDRACPLCAGTGVRPPPLERPLGRHLHPAPRLRCGDCGREAPVVLDLEGPDADRALLAREVARIRAFLGQGDAFCPACFARAVPCDRCGHRVPPAGPGRAAHDCRRDRPVARYHSGS